MWWIDNCDVYGMVYGDRECRKISIKKNNDDGVDKGGNQLEIKWKLDMN